MRDPLGLTTSSRFENRCSAGCDSNDIIPWICSYIEMLLKLAKILWYSFHGGFTLLRPLLHCHWNWEPSLKGRRVWVGALECQNRAGTMLFSMVRLPYMCG